MSNARSLFMSMPLKSLASWNILIGGYVNCGEMKLAKAHFDAMPQKNSVSWMTMIAGYTKLSDVQAAEELFRQMSKKDKLVYNAMIACYAQNGQPKDALKLFSQMLEINSDIQPDEITLSTVVSANSQFGDTSFGTWVESNITKHGIQIDDILSTSLIDLYMKGGDFAKALILFSDLNKKDTITYSAMIMGCGINSMATEACGHCIELKTDTLGYLSHLTNMYTSFGRWEDARNVREVIEEKKLRKTVGCSWVDH